MADKNAIYKYYNGTGYDNIYFKTKGVLVEQDASHRFVSDLEKNNWNAKASTAVATTKANGLMSAGDKAKLDGLISTIKNQVLDVFYPIGSIYMSTSATNPEKFMGGKWQEWGQGRVPIGAGAGTDSNGLSMKFAAGGTGGEYKHRTTYDEIPAITCGDEQSGYQLVYGGSGGFINRVFVSCDKGREKAHNNIQPYITCCMWKRIG